MRKLMMIVSLSLLLMLVMAGLASAQSPAYSTAFGTSITYQNPGTEAALVTFSFADENGNIGKTITRNLAGGAGSSLFIGGLTGTEELPAGFRGGALLGSNKLIVATLVQIPQNSTTIVVRPLSNGLSTATTKVLLATLLKNTFSTTSRFSIQNTAASQATGTIKFFTPGNPSPVATVPLDLKANAVKYFDMGTLSAITQATFNGSAVVEANQNIVGTVIEYSTTGTAAKAFEGVAGGAAPVYMPSALCNAFSDQQQTSYAVQNTSSSTAANVTVTYRRAGDANTYVQTKSIQPGGKESFVTCSTTNIPQGFNGSATVTANDPAAALVVIGKAYSNAFQTAFLGEGSGAPKLALPYVRWTSDSNYASGKYQRTFVAIQNIGDAEVSVNVKYLGDTGAQQGTTHVLTIPAGEKRNSTAADAGLTEFGNNLSNASKAYGGAVIVEGPTGSKLVAIARVASKVASTGQVQAEDYNGIPVP